uniref:Uncharacterized protein n=1 Tax=Romanomermis culicivorax TaxID=13658 RepID=A0A915K2U4_ROMCU
MTSHSRGFDAETCFSANQLNAHYIEMFMKLEIHDGLPQTLYYDWEDVTCEFLTFTLKATFIQSQKIVKSALKIVLITTKKLAGQSTFCEEGRASFNTIL